MVAIARLLLRLRIAARAALISSVLPITAPRPEILVLDRAISALPPDTAARLLGWVRAHAPRGTLIVVVVGPPVSPEVAGEERRRTTSLLKHCDRVVLLGSGRLVAEGSFEELVEQGLFDAGTEEDEDGDGISQD